MPAKTSGKGQGTATKHAKRAVLVCNKKTKTSGKGQCTATKHAKRLVLVCNEKTQQLKEDALAERDDDSQEYLAFKLNGFLNHVVDKNYPWLPGIEAIEDIEDMIFEKVVDWLQNPRDNASYSHSELKLHNKLWRSPHHSRAKRWVGSSGNCPTNLNLPGFARAIARRT